MWEQITGSGQPREDLIGQEKSILEPLPGMGEENDLDVHIMIKNRKIAPSCDS